MKLTLVLIALVYYLNYKLPTILFYSVEQELQTAAKPKRIAAIEVDKTCFIFTNLYV